VTREVDATCEGEGWGRCWKRKERGSDQTRSNVLQVLWRRLGNTKGADGWDIESVAKSAQDHA